MPAGWRIFQRAAKSLLGQVKNCQPWLTECNILHGLDQGAVRRPSADRVSTVAKLQWIQYLQGNVGSREAFGANRSGRIGAGVCLDK